ncbi:hypothetical protein C436_18041 [Haloarcula marismortui ATCC 33800]|uniref:Uncharacterized protein n=1 Tax=Haloarcula marismortui ATCC 33800 TaxID=662476 RepID=M0JMN9_9EURY|nr:hypothetical protein C436_18041 [Haloarcula sinaiiensis ATCC 33800]
MAVVPLRIEFGLGEHFACGLLTGWVQVGVYGGKAPCTFQEKMSILLLKTKATIHQNRNGGYEHFYDTLEYQLDFPLY